jgi:membrane protein required for colicin V production
MDYWLDIILVIPLLWMAYKGFSRGFIMEVTRLLALVAGVYLAARFATLMADYLYKNTSLTNEFLPIIAFALILVGVILLVYLFGKMLEGMLKMASLGWADKAAGAFFGIARGVFLLSLLLMLLNRFSLLDGFEKSEGAEKSFLYRPIQAFAPFLLPILEDVDKDSVVDRMKRGVDKAEETLRDLIPE